MAGIEAHEDAAAQQKRADSERAQAFDLAVSIGKTLARGLQRPGHSAQSHEIRNHIGEGMVGVGDQGLRVENIASEELANGHGQVDEQADAGDPHAGVIFVPRGQVDVVVVMVVVMAMASMAAFLGRHERCSKRTRD